MTACPDRAMLLQGLLDGELDAANAIECEAHLKTCAACQEAYLRLQAVHEAVAAPGVAYAAPASLRGRIEAALEAEAEPARPAPRRAIVPAWLTYGTLGALAAGLAGVMILPSLNEAQIEHQVVAGHVRSLLANHLTDIATSNQHVVKPWFNGRVDFAPPVPELADEGFPLVGGRLDYIGGRIAPAIVYRRRLHTVNLFVWPAEGGAVPADHTARLDGYSLVEWTQGGLRFWAVSDIDLVELKQFRQLFSDRSPK